MDTLSAISRKIGVRNLYTVGLLTLMMLPFFVHYGGFFPWNDTSSQFIPFIMQCKRMLSSGVPLWDWNTLLGDNYLGAYAYYTYTRPYVLLMCLLPYEWIPRCFVVYLYLEFLTMAFLCSYYLRLMGYGRKSRLVGSLLFVFSAYMVSALEYSMFYDPICAYLLLMICVERYLRNMRYSAATLTLAVFAAAVINYYFMVANLLVVAIYFFCRLGALPRNERPGKLYKAVPCVLLGVLMAAIVLVPVMMYIHGSHRSNLDFAFCLSNILERLRCMLMPPGYDGIVPIYFIDSGYYMNSANITIFGVMFAAMYIRRNPRSWLSVLTIIYLACYLTPLNGIFSLFTEQHYTRWVYALNLVMIMATLEWFKQNEGRKTRRSCTLVYAGVCLLAYLLSVGIAVYLRRRAEFDSEGLNLLLMSAIFFANIIALVIVNEMKALSRRWMAATLVSLAVVTLLQMLCFTFNRSGIGGEYAMYGELHIDRWLLENDFDADRKFEYRYEYLPQDTHRDFRYNSAAVNQRPSTRFYHSLRNPEGSRFFETVTTSTHHGVFNADGNPQAFDALLSVRTVVGTDITECAKADYDSAALIPTDARNIYDFGYYIPMGMVYDSYVIDDDTYFTEDFKAGHDMVKGMLNTLIIKAEDEPQLSRYMQKAEFDDTPALAEIVDRRRRHTGDSFSGDTHGFSSTITLPDTMVVFYSVVADKGFTAYIDGEPAQIHSVNLGLSAVVVPAGAHTIRFEYMTPGLKAGAWISLAAWILFAAFFVIVPKVHAKSPKKRV